MIKSQDILEFEMMQKGTINLKWWDYIKGDINILYNNCVMNTSASLMKSTLYQK